MIEESFFFVRVKELVRGPPITCSPGSDVIQVTLLMRDRDISGVIVAERDRPVGMITDRDWRQLIADTGGNVAGRTAREIMRAPLVTIGEDSYVFEAIYKMARHNIHRLVVLDGNGSLAGVVTDTDLLALQTRTPLYLNQDIEAAQTLEDLKRVNARMIDMVSFAAGAGAGTKDMVRLISHFNDAVTRRVIQLLDEREGLRLPDRTSYLVLGSEGRGEQTLRTDQDSAVVYADDISEQDLAATERFSNRLVESLIETGVPPCPGGTMANNPLWRHSLSEWKQRLEQWISVPTPERMVNFGMFQDLRCLHGDDSLAEILKDYIRATVDRNNLFLPYVARNIVRFPPPLGWFGRIRVEKEGEHKGKVNLKKAGIFALTEGVSLLALEAGILDGSTWEKLAALGERKRIPPREVERLDGAFTHLVGLRLEYQLEALRQGQKPANHVDPNALSAREREQLKDSLRTVASFLKAIRDRYKLDFISR